MQSIVRRLSMSKEDKSGQESPRPSAAPSENEQALRDISDMQRAQLEACRFEIHELSSQNLALKDELEEAKNALEVERMPPHMRRIHGISPKGHVEIALPEAVGQQSAQELEALKLQLQLLQSQLSDSQQRERSAAAQLLDLSQENAALRAAANKAASAGHAASPGNGALVSQSTALRERVRALEDQLEAKQEHLAETALLVEKMFTEFSSLQVEFLALKSKGSAVPGDAHDLSALHAALGSKDKQLEAAAFDMAKMAMDYADLGEQLQLSKMERMQLQVLCGDVIQEFNAASMQWETTIRALLRDKFSRESQAAAAKYSEMVDGLAPIVIGRSAATRSQ